MRARTNISLKERKVLTLDKLKGVDFSASPLDVQPYRATDAVNIINDNGTNVKRNGWREILRIRNSSGNAQRINGVFKYKDYLIVHAGARFYRVSERDGKYLKEDITESGAYEASRVDTSRLIDDKSEAYLLKERLYIVGAGDYLVYGTWDDGKTYELRRVQNDEDTFIPTTTININCIEESEDDISVTLDMPNLLNDRRINSLVGSSNEKGATWRLDSAIEPDTLIEVRVEQSDEHGVMDEAKYVNDPTSEDGSKAIYAKDDVGGAQCGSVDFDAGEITLSFATPTPQNMDNVYVTFTAKKADAEYRIKRFSGLDNYGYSAGKYYEDYWDGSPPYYIDPYGPKDPCFKVQLGQEVDTSRPVEITVMYQSATDHRDKNPNIWYVKMVNDTPEHPDWLYIREKWGNKDMVGFNYTGGAKIVECNSIGFYIQTQAVGIWRPYGENSKEIPYTVLENNISVKYYPKKENTAEEEKEDEEKLTAEVINNSRFGTLFGVYGNTDRLFVAGEEEHPNMDFYSAAEDFTYFTDEQCAALGSDASPIAGYARLSDSTLIAYKRDADREASIYYRTGKLNEEYDSEGNLVDGMAIFPLTAGSIGETVISRHACANFAGDTVMLSKNGVFGVVLANNVISTERYTRERSRAINARLCAHKNLSEAVAAVYDNRYYLAIDGVCYVADTRYKYKRQDDIDGSYNYEWWCLDNIPVRVWAPGDGRLRFGTADGRICEFDDEYTDRTSVEIEAGDIGFSGGAEITYSERLKDEFVEGDRISFDGNVYVHYCNVTDVNGDFAIVSEDEILGIYEGTEVYADNVGDSGLEVGRTYVISAVDAGDCTFKLLFDGVPVSLSGGFKLYRRISGRDLFISEKRDTYFKVSDSMGELSVVSYNDGTPTEPMAVITHKRTIEARWYSPVLDLGTNMSSKTLLGMTVVCDPRYRGRISFGIDCKYNAGEWDMKGLGSFSFDSLSFEDFSFDNEFASSYTVRFNKRNVNYAQIRFVSTDDNPCAVNGISLLYKLNKNNIGVV